jgi:hypothetical protein
VRDIGAVEAAADAAGGDGRLERGGWFALRSGLKKPRSLIPLYHQKAWVAESSATHAGINLVQAAISLSRHLFST